MTTINPVILQQLNKGGTSPAPIALPGKASPGITAEQFANAGAINKLSTADAYSQTALTDATVRRMDAETEAIEQNTKTSSWLTPLKECFSMFGSSAGSLLGGLGSGLSSLLGG